MNESYFIELMQCYAYVVEKIFSRFSILQNDDAQLTIGGMIVAVSVFSILIKFIMRRTPNDSSVFRNGGGGSDD